MSLLCNDKGAYFPMQAFGGAVIRKALFVSLAQNINRLIVRMITWAGVTEAKLCGKGKIQPDLDEALSCRYLTWVREHPVKVCAVPWRFIGRTEELAFIGVVNAFIAAHPAALTIVENGEHWFHTPEQLQVLAAWEPENI